MQAASATSSFRTHGTWTRKLVPDSVEVSQGTYELPPLNVKGIASDLVMILMAVGTTCLAVAVYGACSSRRSKKWDNIYEGEASNAYIWMMLVRVLFRIRIVTTVLESVILFLSLIVF